MPPRTLAIGDIHGCLSHFDGLLHALAPTPDDHLILLGDYIDRGPDSAGVLKRIIALSHTHRLTALMGNHEQMLLAARTSHDFFVDWLKNGGDATLRSYAGTRATLKDIPSEHYHFLEHNLVDYFENATHIFIHANAFPDMPMSEQPDFMLRWERCDHIAPHDSGKTLVCGHTPQKSGRPLNKSFAICLDTNACRNGPLTCLDTTTGKIYQATAAGKIQTSHLTDYTEE